MSEAPSITVGLGE